uniref:Uncharacterized protein n=1 Tax=Oryza meridionalis TaxID=40149 RepID=A0A0E0CK64_9ORYZ
MIGGLTSAEFARLLSRQLNGRANRVHFGELPGRSIPTKAGDDVGTPKKLKRAIAKGRQVRSRRATKDTVESVDEEEKDDRKAESEDDGSHGYTPSLPLTKSGAGSRVLPVHSQDVAVPKTLLAISSTVAKPVSVARWKKKKGKVVLIGRAFSDSEGSDGTPTLPVLQRGPRGGRASPPPASDAEAATGGSASAPAVRANISQDERVELVPLPAHQREGKDPAVEAIVSDVTLTAPHFVPADFASRLEIAPFVDGVCHVIARTEGLSLFSEMNEFSKSCAAVKSLFVRPYGRKSCIRPPTGDWRKENEKFVAVQGLPKVKRPLRPVYREMLINGNSYQVIKVAKWMRTHLGQTLEDYDHHRVSCLENSTNFWLIRQEAIACRRYGVVCVSPSSPLKVVYDISDDGGPCSPSHSLGSRDYIGSENVIYL